MQSDINCFQHKFRIEDAVLKLYFKVLRKNLYSLGLLGATPIHYKIGEWTRPKEPISDHPRKGGELWVVARESHARAVQRYMLKKYRMRTRIFQCRIGKIIKIKNRKSHSQRIKTTAVMLWTEVFPARKQRIRTGDDFCD